MGRNAYTFQPGHPRYGGSKKGKPYRKTVERREAQARALAKAIEAADIPEFTITELNPLNVMLFVMVERFRAGDHQSALVAAQAAAPYVHARLSSSDVKVTTTHADKSDEELQAEIAEVERRIAAARTTH
jgi:hypothetical protein